MWSSCDPLERRTGRNIRNCQEGLKVVGITLSLKDESQGWTGAKAMMSDVGLHEGTAGVQEGPQRSKSMFVHCM